MKDKKEEMTMQLGKNGLTDNFIMNLQNSFKERGSMKVVLLKSAGHEKENAKGISEDILKKLGPNYTARVIGFTIILKKWRKPRVKK